MKLIKTASGKQRIKISKSEWESIGRTAGWMKEAQLTPNQWQNQQQQINNRVRTMIQTFNRVTGQNIPETQDGYNQVGRSDGIMKQLTDPTNRNNLIQIPEVIQVAQRMGVTNRDLLTLAPKFIYKMLQDWFLSISK